MITNTIFSFSKRLSKRHFFQPTRNFQVTIVGAASKLGYNVALLLTKNSKITRLKLYDIDRKVLDIAKLLSKMSVGPRVCGFAGDGELDGAVMASQLVLLVHNTDINANMDSVRQACYNAPLVRAVCAALANCNHSAFLGISTNPVNVMVPYAVRILKKFEILDSKKVFGITNAGANIVRSAAAIELGVDERFLSIPVIGGNTAESVVPLFSRLEPQFYTLSKSSVKKINELVRVSFSTTPQSRATALPTFSQAINEFTENIRGALGGQEKELYCYVENANFGTKFFSGPTLIGQFGVVKVPKYFNMSQVERNMLIAAVRCINRDVEYGEKLATEPDYVL